MQLAFETRQLRDICESENGAEQLLGTETAKELKRRLADLRAAACVGDLPSGGQAGAERYFFTLSDGSIVELVPNHLKNPLLDSGEVDWRKVVRLKLIRIGEHV